MFLIPRSAWQVKKTKKKGRGIFALKDIEAGTIIGDYLGKVVHPRQEEALEKKYGFYAMYYHRNATIFPNLKREGIHLLNHSCAPNCWMYTYQGHALFFAIRKIFKGEELTIVYLLGPQGKDCSPCPDRCFCESFNCTQTMHTPEKKFRAWVDYDERIARRTKAQPVKFNQDLLPLKKYPRSIPDHYLYTLVGNQKKDPMRFPDKKIPAVSKIRARIRQTGRYLLFPHLNLTVRGVSDGLLIAQ